MKIVEQKIDSNGILLTVTCSKCKKTVSTQLNRNQQDLIKQTKEMNNLAFDSHVEKGECQ